MKTVAEVIAGNKLVTIGPGDTILVAARVLAGS